MMQNQCRTIGTTTAHRRAILREIAWVVAGSALIALSARVQAPLAPVPMTMQTFAVLVVGGVLGARRGGLAAGAYLLEGVAGLPVFAGPVMGPMALLGPGGAYLLAFPAAAYLAGRLTERFGGRCFWRTSAALAAADLLILALGFAWLVGQMGFGAAFAMGIAPFWLVEPLKIALATGVVTGCRRWCAGGTVDARVVG